MNNGLPNKVVLEIKLLAPPPSFKNHKRVTRSGAMITRPDIKERMERIEDALESALRLAFQQSKGATSMDVSLPSWIASCVPGDDSWNEVPEIAIKGILSDEPTLRIEIEEILDTSGRL